MKEALAKGKMVQQPRAFDERYTGKDIGEKLDVGDNQQRQGQKRGAFQASYPIARPRIVHPPVPQDGRWVYVQHPKFPQYHDPPFLTLNLEETDVGEESKPK